MKRNEKLKEQFDICGKQRDKKQDTLMVTLNIKLVPAAGELNLAQRLKQRNRQSPFEHL